MKQDEGSQIAYRSKNLLGKIIKTGIINLSMFILTVGWSKVQNYDSRKMKIGGNFKLIDGRP